MSSIEVARFDAQLFVISRRGSCSPETRSTLIDQDPLDTDPCLLLKNETSRANLMDAQRYDSSKRTSQGSSTKANGSPKPEAVSTTALDPEAVIERLLLEAELLKLLDAQRYDPRSRTSSPEPEKSRLSDRNTIGSDSDTFDGSDTGSSSYGSAYGSSPGCSDSPSTPVETAESIVTDTDDASSIHFSEPMGHDQETRFAASWKTGVTVTTRTVIQPIPHKSAITSKRSTPFFTPPTSRPSSPKSPRTILRALNCVTDDHDAAFDSDIARAMEERQKAAQPPSSEPLTIFVTQQVDGPLAAEEREREQLWREAMCSLHFGGDWEQMNKRFPPGKPRW
ncbi:hypothetical protein BT96DRAFT_546062 [Gymnopus androsaceus JB14]|uniref:Uncharacterized protein n=1 Tax=Gymnopus androsaceus JB14 TaxID=1447944 RepID=A0A6A4GLX1_9AGAR|nr:hypothetical protein BT96DRAFT_546062 [Gymnopus androsaceus JB14]